MDIATRCWIHKPPIAGDVVTVGIEVVAVGQGEQVGCAEDEFRQAAAILVGTLPRDGVGMSKRYVGQNERRSQHMERTHTVAVVQI